VSVAVALDLLGLILELLDARRTTLRIGRHDIERLEDLGKLARNDRGPLTPLAALRRLDRRAQRQQVIGGRATTLHREHAARRADEQA